MSVTAKSLFAPLQAPNANTTLYTANAVRTIIDKFTGTNTTAGAVTLTVFLVAAAGAAGVTNEIVAVRSLAANECYTFPEIVGHVLNAGDFIVVSASAAASITVRASGREVTG